MVVSSTSYIESYECRLRLYTAFLRYISICLEARPCNSKISLQASKFCIGLEVEWILVRCMSLYYDISMYLSTRASKQQNVSTCLKRMCLHASSWESYSCDGMLVYTYIRIYITYILQWILCCPRVCAGSSDLVKKEQSTYIPLRYKSWLDCGTKVLPRNVCLGAT